MLWAFDGMKGATMSNLRMQNSPHVSFIEDFGGELTDGDSGSILLRIAVIF